ncbi:MAG: YjbQ family protein [Ignavibacteria bacterium]|jgi:secondary thiamine-phosphate synthase enzyme|nr:YjbQ family protein [Ignavibacteria bacterium]HEX2961629.1 secondary thiamine-phosphate synthase enzyme YjbQ [Ignavibacteriales bacterium]MCU7497948.1 YjbQ family protein [Ignavibacteria bacterium]MCU7514384.1 YjbQ family protein [Ignavibacteria bacterium]MCU7519840.1 YjbQ family protein [Ignavibacteria bacterium]
MNCFQKEIVLSAKARGFSLITDEVLSQIPELRNFSAGIFHLFIQHTSASLSVNENADPDVRRDMEEYFNRVVPENAPYFEHTTEGSDDMPAHIKSSILGSSITLPVTQGRLNLGTWQGIYLCEHRNHGGRRHLVATIMGEKR